MVDNISKKTVRARKTYYCQFSGKVINIGEKHVCEVNKYDGQIYTFRVHEEAYYLAHELDMYGKGTNNEGFQYDDYDELLEDYLYDNDLYEEYENHGGLKHDFVYKHYIKNKVVEDE